MVCPDQALPGRETYAFTLPDRHAVNGQPLRPPFAPGLQTIVFGMGCFWGAERRFWQHQGVVSTA
ncbi:MAG: peptide-methionine (S)-S-oxide reductase, partial [Oligoflexia bacterium]|nr:peptide-methionine (S)-S-oxide reductase [Oligoflexia bacterium]